LTIRKNWLNFNMAKHCAICGKVGIVGHNVSHAHNITKRRFEPNLQRVRAQFGSETKKIWVCTHCIKAGKVQKG